MNTAEKNQATPKPTPTLSELKKAISEHWKDVPVGAAAVHFISCIQERNAPAIEWRWSEILGVFGNSATPKEIVGAMAILTQSEWAIFRACAVFQDESSQRHRLSSEDFQRVQDEDTLAHPVTGELITRASTRVEPVFELIPGIIDTPPSEQKHFIVGVTCFELDRHGFPGAQIADAFVPVDAPDEEEACKRAVLWHADDGVAVEDDDLQWKCYAIPRALMFKATKCLPVSASDMDVFLSLTQGLSVGKVIGRARQRAEG